MALFSRQKAKLKKAANAEFSGMLTKLDRLYDVTPMRLLEELFSYKKTPSEVPMVVLQEVLKRVNPSYTLVGLKTIKGEGAIIRAKDFSGEEICLKVLHHELNTKYINELREADYKKDEWLRWTSGVKDWNTRFVEGIKVQRKIKEAILRDRIDGFDVPAYRNLSPVPFLYLEQEWIDGVDLIDYLREKNDVIKSLEIFKYILDCVEFVHDHGFIHRDIKPSNFMIAGRTESEIKIYFLDWSGAKVEGEQRDLTAPGEGIGTLGYADPEQLALGMASAADKKSDIFSLGITLFECWHRQVIQNELRREDWQDKVKVQAFLDRCKQALPDSLIKIFAKATCLDRSKRYNSACDFSADIVAAVQKMAGQQKINAFKIVDVKAFFSDIIGDGETAEESPNEIVVDTSIENTSICDKCAKPDICKEVSLCDKIYITIERK